MSADYESLFMYAYEYYYNDTSNDIYPGYSNSHVIEQIQLRKGYITFTYGGRKIRNSINNGHEKSYAKNEARIRDLYDSQYQTTEGFTVTIYMVKDPHDLIIRKEDESSSRQNDSIYEYKRINSLFRLTEGKISWFDKGCRPTKKSYETVWKRFKEKIKAESQERNNCIIYDEDNVFWWKNQTIQIQEYNTHSHSYIDIPVNVMSIENMNDAWDNFLVITETGQKCRINNWYAFRNNACAEHTYRYTRKVERIKSKNYTTKDNITCFVASYISDDSIMLVDRYGNARVCNNLKKLRSGRLIWNDLIQNEYSAEYQGYHSYNGNIGDIRVQKDENLECKLISYSKVRFSDGYTTETSIFDFYNGRIVRRDKDMRKNREKYQGKTYFSKGFPVTIEKITSKSKCDIRIEPNIQMVDQSIHDVVNGRIKIPFLKDKTFDQFTILKRAFILKGDDYYYVVRDKRTGRKDIMSPVEMIQKAETKKTKPDIMEAS